MMNSEISTLPAYPFHLENLILFLYFTDLYLTPPPLRGPPEVGSTSLVGHRVYYRFINEKNENDDVYIVCLLSPN